MRRRKASDRPSEARPPAEQPTFYSIPRSFTWDGSTGRRFFIAGSVIRSDDPAAIEIVNAGGASLFVREEQ